MQGWMKENCVIYACTTAAVLGLFYMSGSWHSMWAFFMLGWCNYPNKA